MDSFKSFTSYKLLTSYSSHVKQECHQQTEVLSKSFPEVWSALPTSERFGMCRTWTINLFPDLSGVTCRKWKLELCFLRSFYCLPLQFIIDLVSDIWCLEGVNVKPRCAKTQTRSICFGKMLRHHFLKGEVAFQVTCAGGYKKSYPRRWKDSSKIFRPAWHMYFLSRCG